LRKVLIFSATSAIAQATARLFAAEEDRLFLVARDADKLRSVADDLEARGAGRIVTAVMDALEYDRHAAIVDEAKVALNGLDTVLIAHGTLPNQKACESSFDMTREALEVNAVSAISLLTHIANLFEQQSRGSIAVISSVAGDRGRQSNYVYGAAKGTVSIFLQGLRNRLHQSGVQVLTIEPGFVDTPMTAKLSKGPLWVTPDIIAHGIMKGIRKGHDRIYLPGFWRWIMLVIRNIPESLFKRMKL